ncbi:hypothetical protein Ancab_025203 [Ancistrocladus abbreviatus]
MVISQGYLKDEKKGKKKAGDMPMVELDKDNVPMSGSLKSARMGFGLTIMASFSPLSANPIAYGSVSRD